MVKIKFNIWFKILHCFCLYLVKFDFPKDKILLPLIMLTFRTNMSMDQIENYTLLYVEKLLKEDLLPNVILFFYLWFFFRRDSLPTGTFTKYTWNLTNLRHVQQIFDTTIGLFLHTRINKIIKIKKNIYCTANI